jgi:hypothetical protein
MSQRLAHWRGLVFRVLASQKYADLVSYSYVFTYELLLYGQVDGSTAAEAAAP